MKQRVEWIWFILWTFFIFALCTMPTRGMETPKLVPHADKIVHFGLFFIFSILFFNVLQKKLWVRKGLKIAIVLFSVALYGAMIEWLQGAYFARSADFWDWVADIFGGIAGILCYTQLLKKWQKITGLLFKNR